MPTKYDVFAAVVQHAPCTAKELPFETPIYAHLNALLKDGLIEKKEKRFIPTTNQQTKHTFAIIKYSLKNGFDHNLFFAKNMATIIMEIFQHAPSLRPPRLKGNQDIAAILRFLEAHQFILLTRLKPRIGIVLKHRLFTDILALHHVRTDVAQAAYISVEEQLTLVSEKVVDRLDESVFEFLAGSAQLEGNTITPGETKELLLNDVYPDKPPKDIQMVKNLNEAMRYLLEHVTAPITPDHIKELNKLVLFSLHAHAGKYKISQNTIQGNPHFRTAAPSEVPVLMEKYCAYLATIQTKERIVQEIGRVHNELQRIHPFADGNSRTTRMVVNWLLLRHGLPLLVLRNGCFEAYMGLTKLSKERDDNTLKMLLQQILYHEHVQKQSKKSFGDAVSVREVKK